jgi:REP element-mobilizing transposase RayT
MIRIDPPPRLPARGGNGKQPARTHHVRLSTLRGKPLFRDMASVQILMACVRALDRRGDTESLAVVVMPDHLHWVVRLRGARSLHRVVRSMTLESARAVCSGRRRRPTEVWEPVYVGQALSEPEAIGLTARYIAENAHQCCPARASHGYAVWDMTRS